MTNQNMKEEKEIDAFTFLRNMMKEADDNAPDSPDEYVKRLQLTHPLGSRWSTPKFFTDKKSKIVLKHMLAMLEELSNEPEHLTPDECYTMREEFTEIIGEIVGDMNFYPMWIHHYHEKDMKEVMKKVMKEIKQMK